jgi:hypothetical protein
MHFGTLSGKLIFVKTGTGRDENACYSEFRDMD